MGRRQQEKSQQTREELMAAAIELFGEKGFIATTISEITERAGYAKGSFYRHWKSKDGLFLDIIEHKLASYREARERRISDARSFEDVYDIIWDFLDSMVDDHNWSAVFLEFTVHASRDPELKAELNKGIYRLSNEIFAGMVESYVDTGYPAEKLGALNTALFEGFLIHHILGTRELDKRDVRQAALALAKALGKRPEAK